MGQACLQFWKTINGMTVIILSLCLAVPTIASPDTNDSSQNEDATTRARKEYDKGQAAYASQDYATAEVHFQTAYDIKPHPAVLKSIAECKLQMGQTPEAVALLEEVVRSENYSDKDKIHQRIADAKAEIGELIITSKPEGAVIALNGRVLEDVTPLSLYVNPGMQTIAFSYNNYPEQIQEIVVGKGQSETVFFDFSDLIASDTGTPPQLIDPFEDDDDTPSDTINPDITHSSGDTTRDTSIGPPPAFWAMAAVTGVGVVSGTVFGTMALANEKDYRDSGDAAVRDSGKRSAVIADISFATAVAAAITGTIILIADKNKKESLAAAPNRRLHVVPVATDTNLGMGASLTF